MFIDGIGIRDSLKLVQEIIFRAENCCVYLENPTKQIFANLMTSDY